jgi:hypothetical protein
MQGPYLNRALERPYQQHKSDALSSTGLRLNVANIFWKGYARRQNHVASDSAPLLQGLPFFARVQVY